MIENMSLDEIMNRAAYFRIWNMVIVENLVVINKNAHLSTILLFS